MTGMIEMNSFGIGVTLTIRVRSAILGYIVIPESYFFM
jgi:hypothetical protein